MRKADPTAHGCQTKEAQHGSLRREVAGYGTWGKGQLNKGAESGIRTAVVDLRGRGWRREGGTRELPKLHTSHWEVGPLFSLGQ